ncbi:hypothetical protein pb186bvf_014270 [Paramecium bursaria]
MLKEDFMNRFNMIMMIIGYTDYNFSIINQVEQKMAQRTLKWFLTLGFSSNITLFQYQRENTQIFSLYIEEVLIFIFNNFILIFTFPNPLKQKQFYLYNKKIIIRSFIPKQLQLGGTTVGNNQCKADSKGMKCLSLLFILKIILILREIIFEYQAEIQWFIKEPGQSSLHDNSIQYEFELIETFPIILKKQLSAC